MCAHTLAVLMNDRAADLELWGGEAMTDGQSNNWSIAVI